MTNAERFLNKEDRLKVAIERVNSRYDMHIYYDPKHCSELIPLFYKKNIKKHQLLSTYLKWGLTESTAV